MADANITMKCPMCENELHIANFQMADVWKDNRKQHLFVCRHCAQKAMRRREYAHPQDVFRASKEARNG